MAEKESSSVLPPKDAVHQAGGGVTAEPQSVKTLNASLLKQLDEVFKLHTDKKDKTWHKDQLLTFVSHVQQEGESSIPVALLDKTQIDYNDFLHYMSSPASNIVAPPSVEDLSWPLSSYFISSSHNTYLTGNQLYSNASTEAYKNVLLRGCRCIEVDVWDGDDTDSEDSSSSGDESSVLTEKRKEQIKKAKDRLPTSLTSRLEKTTLGQKLDKFVEKKVTPKVPNVTPAATASSSASAPAPAPTPPQTAAGSHAADHAAPASTAPNAAPGKASPPAPLGKKLTKRITGVEPRVLHGYTLTKEVSFREVCGAIKEYAFTVTDYPLIVSLEVHCRAQQQEIMVAIMKEVWSSHLLPHSAQDADHLPAPGDLRAKILIKVKYAAPVNEKGNPNPPAEPEAHDSDEDVAPTGSTMKKHKKPSKIIPALSQMGIYTKGVSFKSLKQPEASMPTHIFALSEKRVLEVHEKSGADLFNHNRDFLMRAYPSGMRIRSSNLDPALFWRKGIQIVALNWQKWDEGMMLNEGMFAGTGGMVLKPEGYRGEKKDSSAAMKYTPKSVAIDIKHQTLDLKIEVFGAQSIPLPPTDIKAKSFHPYLKVELHVETPNSRLAGKSSSAPKSIPAEGVKEREGEYKAKTKTLQGCDPDFRGEVLEFRAVPGVVDELSFVRFIIKDNERMAKDDLAAWACVRLDRLRSGYRFVHLLDCKGQETDGVVLVKVTKKLV